MLFRISPPPPPPPPGDAVAEEGTDGGSDAAFVSCSVSSLSRWAAKSLRIMDLVALVLLALAAWSRLMSSRKAVSLSEAERAEERPEEEAGRRDEGGGGGVEERASAGGGPVDST